MLNSTLASGLTLFSAGLSTLYISLKTLRSKKPAALFAGDDSRNAVNLQSLHGYNPHSLVAVSGANRMWFDFQTQSCAAYSEHGKVWLVAGDIIAPGARLPEATKKFLAAAKDQKRIVAFMPATENFTRSIISKDFKVVKVGASPYFDLTSWDPRGNRAKHLRNNLNQGRRAGISVTKIMAIEKSFQMEVESLCEEWLTSRRAPVKFGWLFDLSPFLFAEHKRFFAARNEQGKLVGLLAASPIPAREGWYLEDVLRAPDAPNGTADLLVYEALKTFASEGAKIATLGTIPLVSDGEDTLSTNGNFLTRNALKYSCSHLQSIYGFDGLRRFKSRFVPSWWESEYVVVSNGMLVAPRVARAFFRAILPNGLMDLAKRQIANFRNK